MLRKSPQRTVALPVATAFWRAPIPAKRVKHFAPTSRAQRPNEAVNLLKTKIAHFQTSAKAVNLLKIQALVDRKPSSH